jgi:hypothetical protein
MKKVTLFIAAFLFISISNAQDYSIEEVEVVQNLFGAEKKAIIDANVDLTGVNAESFWNLYNEYESFRKELGKEKIELLHKYTSKEGSVTNEQADALMDAAIPLRQREDKLILDFTKKIRKATSSVVAVQFYQIEHYISDGIRFTILHNIEFIQDIK